jgi:hypothetical protein
MAINYLRAKWRKVLAWAILIGFVAAASLPLFVFCLVAYAVYWAFSEAFLSP